MNFKETLSVYRQYGMKNFIEWRRGIILNEKKRQFVAQRDREVEFSKEIFGILYDSYKEGNLGCRHDLLLRIKDIQEYLSGFEKEYLEKYGEKITCKHLDRYIVTLYDHNDNVAGLFSIKECRSIIDKTRELINISRDDVVSLECSHRAATLVGELAGILVAVRNNKKIN